MLNKKAQAGWIIVIVIILVVGFFIFWNVYDSNSPVTGSVIKNSGSQNYEVEITSSGFSPKELTINKGDSITWINKDSPPHWPASASHPTHTKYTGVDYSESGSYAGSLACKSKGVAKEGAFDSCNGLAIGESWTFTFNQVGSWSYHDHLVSGQFGKIIVG